MARMPSGLRKAAGGWRNPLDKRREPIQQPQRSPEDAAATREFYRKLREDLIRQQSNPSLDKVVDSYARVAVEGDTDMNHDNVEAAE